MNPKKIKYTILFNDKYKNYSINRKVQINENKLFYISYLFIFS